eukprot:SAG31_NODE_3823_length_3849_cov_2.562133_7_plen_74_part_00
MLLVLASIALLDQIFALITNLPSDLAGDESFASCSVVAEEGHFQDLPKRQSGTYYYEISILKFCKFAGQPVPS